jgi:hypothetical protein
MVYRGGKLDIKMRVRRTAPGAQRPPPLPPPPPAAPPGLNALPTRANPPPPPCPDALALVQVEFVETKEVLYDKLLFSNIDDATGGMLSTIVKKGAVFTAARAGLYAFCLDNRMARWTAKVMTLDLDISDPNDPLARAEREAEEARNTAWLTGSDVDPKMAVTLMRAATNRLHAKLSQLTNAQAFHLQREKRHRSTVESTNTRVQWWAVAQTAVVIAAAVAQVLAVKSWFPDDARRSRTLGA